MEKLQAETERSVDRSPWRSTDIQVEGEDDPKANAVKGKLEAAKRRDTGDKGQQA